MVFSSAVAGPSRLPYRAASQAVRAASSSATSTASPSSSGPAFPKRPSFRQVKRGPRAGPVAFEKWYDNFAIQYAAPQRGRAAKWMGGNVPFPNNPSFRPPPPLSNDLQNMIADELNGGKRTVGQISQQFNVSKARIEAIRKLKAIEAEHKRQGVPLQKAFQQGMETLLRVTTPVNPRSGLPDMEATRYEAEERIAHPSTGIERSEEHGFDHGERGSMFADLNDPSQRPSGIEKDVWEFRDEATVIADRAAKIEALAAEKAADKAAEDAEAANFAAGKDTAPTAAAKELASSTTLAASEKNSFRFVNTSKFRNEVVRKGKKQQKK